MKICDICKTNPAGYNDIAVIENNGNTKELELCGKCWREFHHREILHKCQAYEETVKTVTGELPRKSHWWNMFGW